MNPDNKLTLLTGSYKDVDCVILPRFDSPAKSSRLESRIHIVQANEAHKKDNKEG